MTSINSTNNHWIVEYTKSARKEITELDESISKIIKRAIEEKLMCDPVKFGRPLRRCLAGFFKLRVGDYRIIYEVNPKEKIIIIQRIAHRQDVYKGK